MKAPKLSILSIFAFALFAAPAFALPPYGVHQDMADETGSGFYGFYLVPPNTSARYLWGYDGSVNFPSANPLKFVAIGDGLTYDGTTLAATPLVRSFAYPTRALNTCFQVSSSRDAQVSYAVDLAAAISLTTGQTGTVYLRTYSNSNCTSGTQEVTRFTNGNTGTLTIGLALTQTVTGHLTGIVPAGAYAQIVTENNSGSPSFTARPGQEVLL